MVKRASHARVQVEAFTRPAGSDGFSVGVLEAVHPRQPINLGRIMLGLLPAFREGEMVGQVLITHPWLAGLPVRFVEYPTIAVTGDGHSALMHHGVMPLT